MQLIKLDAIDSTNDFLKDLNAKNSVENFTVVTAENQTKGKGQMGAMWHSEIGKNLIMSVLIKDSVVAISSVFQLNIAVALSVIAVLKQYQIPDLSIKWPNDIMSANKKIGGILIENTIKFDGSIESVAGLGLNVNQTNFENLPKASSLFNVTGILIDKEELLKNIVESMKVFSENIKSQPEENCHQYESLLFKEGIPMPFEHENNRFMGIIKGVDQNGRIKIMMEDDSFKTFEIKQIQMLY